MNFLGRILDRVICTAMAILFAQAPAYVSQYEAVLEESTQQLSQEIQSIKEQAEDNGENVDVFLNRLANNPDSLLRREGIARMEKLGTYQDMTQKIDTLQSVPEWKRPWTLYHTWDSNYDQAINYQLFIPLSLTGGIYAFVGLLVGMLIAYLLRLLYQAIWGKKRKLPA